MIKKLILIIPLLSLLSTGCFIKNKDLNKMFFPISIGLSYEENKYKVYLYILNTSTISVIETENYDTSTSFILISEEDESISEAFTKLGLKAATYVSAIKVKSIVLHKSIFEQGPIDYYQVGQYFVNNPIFRTKVQLFLTNTDLDKFYNVKYMLVGSRIYSHDNNQVPEILRAETKPSFLLDSLKSYADYNRMYYFPVIDVKNETLEEGDEKGELSGLETYYYNGICYTTYNDKKIDCLSEDEAEGHKWYHQIKHITIEASNDESTINVIIKKADWDTKLKDNNYYIKIKTQAYINFNLSSLSIDKITDKINEKIKQEIKTTLTKSYEKDIDIYHLNDLALRKDKQLKYNLENVNIEVETSIINTTYYKY